MTSASKDRSTTGLLSSLSMRTSKSQKVEKEGTPLTRPHPKPRHALQRPTGGTDNHPRRRFTITCHSGGGPTASFPDSLSCLRKLNASNNQITRISGLSKCTVGGPFCSHSHAVHEVHRFLLMFSKLSIPPTFQRLAQSSSAFHQGPAITRSTKQRNVTGHLHGSMYLCIIATRTPLLQLHPSSSRAFPGWTCPTTTSVR